MAFWDDLEKKATDATTNVMSRVKGVSDTTRLNSMVTEEEKRIRDIYFKIGQTYVALHGQENDAAFVNLLNALKASQLKVEQYKQEIMDIKGVRRCENWRTASGSPSSFSLGMVLLNRRSAAESAPFWRNRLIRMRRPASVAEKSSWPIWSILLTCSPASCLPSSSQSS